MFSSWQFLHVNFFNAGRSAWQDSINSISVIILFKLLMSHRVSRGWDLGTGCAWLQFLTLIPKHLQLAWDEIMFLRKKNIPIFSVTICFHIVETADKADQDQILVAASFPRELKICFGRSYATWTENSWHEEEGLRPSQKQAGSCIFRDLNIGW